ncbi:MAG: ATP-dependent helicase, partial [Gemmatimonadota bacterium]|nr:ATP-dependent helicase [Gemmatimonadota bacterium]
RDLQEQLATLQVPDAGKVSASTLHSLCFKVLASEQAFAYTHRIPRPLMQFEVDCLEQDLAHRFGGKKATRSLLEAYEAAWARLQREQPGHAVSAEDQEFETVLVAWLRFHEAMLIGELVPLTLSFISANPGLPVLPALSNVLVDEFQDLNRADQALVEALRAAADILVIGDDNQSIYSFRYAHPEGLRSFPVEMHGTVQYSITDCRRCPANIVAVSNALISHDPHTSRPQPLVGSNGRPPADLHIVQHATLHEEVQSTADFIHHVLSERPDLPAGRVMVLAPRRFIGNAIKDALIARGRNALSYFQEDALSDEDAAQGFCLLTLLVNPLDRAALRSWLGFGSSDRRHRPYTRLRDQCESQGTALHDALTAMSSGGLTIPYTKPLLERWEELQRRLMELANVTGLDLVNALWPEASQSLTEIRSLAGSIALDAADNEELLDRLREAITQPELPGSDSDIVQVMSLHKSKGLTRDVVVVAGCMAGTLPFIDSDDRPEVQQAKYDEQRRLFYVAITRTTEMLVISAAAALPLRDALRGGATVTRKRFMNGEMHAITAFSPFISELGASAPPALTTAAWRQQVGI